MIKNDHEIVAQEARDLTKLITDPWNMSSFAQRLEAALGDLEPLLQDNYDWLNEKLKTLYAENLNPRDDLEFWRIFHALMEHPQMEMLFQNVFTVTCAELGIAPHRAWARPQSIDFGSNPAVN